MIAKHIRRKSQDRYKRLAKYIANAACKGEKLDKLWIRKCDSGTGPDDLELAIQEIEAVQAQNTRAASEKTYHLMISFQTGEKPDAKTLYEIEEAFAKSLGYEDHQRIAATHQNTDNYHIHVAINKIHPKTKTIYTPYRDFKTLEKTARKMEKKYRLGIDLGRADKKDQNRQNTAARDYEAHSWQQSFDSYVKENKGHLANSLARSKSWKEFHYHSDKIGIQFRPKGAGLIIANQNGREQIKASTLGREFSKKSLEALLGPYSAPEQQKRSQHQKTHETRQRRQKYGARPVLKHKDIPSFWKRYIGLRKKNQLQSGRPFITFKEFLFYYAIDLHDPLAIVLIQFHKRIMEDLSKSLTPSGDKK